MQAKQSRVEIMSTIQITKPKPQVKPRIKGSMHEDIETEAKRISREVIDIYREKVEAAITKVVQSHLGDLTEKQKALVKQGAKLDAEYAAEAYDIEDMTADLHSIIKQIIAGKRPEI